MISHTSMLQASSQVHFGFWLIDFLPWVLTCLQVSKVFIYLSVVEVQWFPREQIRRHRSKHTWGRSRSSVYGLAYPRRHQVVRRQGHQDMTVATSWIIVESSIPDAVNARGRLLTNQRWNKFTSSNKSTSDESNFGDSGYEVTTRHEDHMKIENGRKKEFDVLKQQLKREHEAA